jgi:hypothetical protein
MTPPRALPEPSMPHAQPNRPESPHPIPAVRNASTWVLGTLKKAAVALWRAA